MRGNFTHGQSHCPEYRVWKNMNARCHNPKNTNYPKYGGRGITVCPEWRRDFVTFLRDMGPKPGPQFSIEREDNASGYSKENCCWATAVTQARNRRSNTHLTHEGKTMTLIEWSKERGIKPSTLCQRLAKGWTTEKTLLTPLWGHYD
jgi:hypothetical protein